MAKILPNKKVFISYAWTSQEHVDYVEQFAKRLSANGIYVVLDQWDLKPGHDKYAFMENCVKDSSIDKVLMIVDKAYAEKADKREGGVGTESMIISKEVYENISNEKFIPIVIEFGNDGKPCLPVFLSSRMYINFSEPSLVEEEYEKLVRLINNIPAKSRPPLGDPPSYLSESAANVYKTGFLVNSVRNQLDKNRNSINRISTEFFTLFEDELWQFVIPELRNDNNKIEIVSNKLHEFQSLKRSFVDFISIVTSDEYAFEAGYLISFFEKVHLYQRPRNTDIPQWYPGDYEVFKIVFQELFVYCVAISIKNLNFCLAGELLNATYVFDTTLSSRIENPDRSFCGIIAMAEIFDSNHHNNLAPIGKYYLDNLYGISKDEFVTADVICHILCFLLKKNRSYYDWFPRSNVHYGSVRSGIRFKFFEKLESRRFYEKVKPIFNELEIEELRDRLLIYKAAAGRRFSFGMFNEVPHIHEFIPPEKLGSEK